MLNCLLRASSVLSILYGLTNLWALFLCAAIMAHCRKTIIYLKNSLTFFQPVTLSTVAFWALNFHFRRNETKIRLKPKDNILQDSKLSRSRSSLCIHCHYSNYILYKHQTTSYCKTASSSFHLVSYSSCTVSTEQTEANLKFQSRQNRLSGACLSASRVIFNFYHTTLMEKMANDYTVFYWLLADKTKTGSKTFCNCSPLLWASRLCYYRLLLGRLSTLLFCLRCASMKVSLIFSPSIAIRTLCLQPTLQIKASNETNLKP